MAEKQLNLFDTRAESLYEGDRLLKPPFVILIRAGVAFGLNIIINPYKTDNPYKTYSNTIPQTDAQTYFGFCQHL